MASLKQHQATMVSMLASGTAIPTSAIRLAHALHDVLARLNDTNAAPVAHTERRIDATTPGLNGAALAYDMAAVKPKRSSAEQQISMLNNTIRQLRESNSDLRWDRDWLKKRLDEALTMINESVAESFTPEQAGCRKEDVDWSECQHDYVYHDTISAKRCMHCGDVAK